MINSQMPEEKQRVDFRCGFMDECDVLRDLEICGNYEDLDDIRENLCEFGGGICQEKERLLKYKKWH